ncbi:efflux RND transporter periplasmic adaptor subunit [Aestuariibacter sp. AA17]|uniref:Efflux RND transporter periplasmic adaptor subunit n=1 Tax=Fluctibacter corallii TaxID=2984329 RepID=A0ABT3A558_9ALTE|nr:efflux RND transporter periplasmic adaptor subunit [Aestuariibacter sp. AA17]MCV2883727.1 efflux RND transporter periplasmic adaptor subunit [Aestuariibacter sp. AA17]
MTRLITRMRRQPAWIALLIFLLLCLWLFSGVGQQKAAEQTQSKAKQQTLAEVRTRILSADEVSREISLYGRTEPDRTASLKAEVTGKVIDVLVKEGQFVKAGEILLVIEEKDLQRQLDAAKSLKNQREIELKAAMSLIEKGYQSKVAKAQAQAALDSAVAAIEQLDIDLNNTRVRAPFDGVLNMRHVEVGDSLREGDLMVTFVDLDPLVITANVTENDVSQLQLNQEASGELLSGQRMEGRIRYISSVSNEGTNTFPIEIAVPNPERKWRAGMSTSVSIPLEKTWAIKITPASMALDKHGNLGVKIVEESKVKFVPIDIVRSDAEGVWLSGLGERAQIITFGHGYVNDGDTVNAIVVDSEI